MLTVLLFKMPRNHWRDALPYSLIISGALGNLVDRFRFGYVVDFIEWYYKSYSWPGLPATIESAVKSGRTAAEWILKGAAETAREGEHAQAG